MQVIPGLIGETRDQHPEEYSQHERMAATLLLPLLLGSLGLLGNWEEEQDGTRLAGMARLGKMESHRLSTVQPPGAACAVFAQKRTEQV